MTDHNCVKLTVPISNKLMPWLGVLTFLILIVGIETPAQEPLPLTNVCPEAIAKRLKRHTVKTGETLESIAQQYQLVAETVKSANP
ncbi:MAG: hypothetical protein RLZZ490_571, partial [Cyanobacteriota bacterium]